MKISFNKIIFLIVWSFFIFTTISAQDSLQKGIELYKSGSYTSSVKFLKKVKKNDKEAYLGFYYLGLSYKHQNKTKKAVKAFKISVELNPNYANSKTALAYLSLQTGNFSTAINMALDSVLLDTENHLNYYILGLANFNLENNSEAIKYVDISIEKNPDYEDALTLRKKILKDSPELAANKKDREVYRQRRETYQQTNETLEDFITRVAKSDRLNYWEEQSKSIDFFVEYFKEQKVSKNEKESKNTRNIKILSKPRPGYSESAKNANIGGLIRVMVGFQADGKIRHAIVTKGLGYGLDKRVIKAVKNIKFKPAMKDNKTITLVKVVQYSFTIY